MKNVFWSPVTCTGFSEVTFPKPEKVLPELNIPLFQDTELLRCPSFTAHLKNTYVVRSPVDIEIKWDINQNAWVCNWNDERSNIFFIRHSECQVFSFKISYLFVSDDSSMEAELRPAHFHHCEFTHKAAFISGDLSIGKYLRATDCAFILRPEYKYLRIKVGDPLFYITFKSRSDSKISLKKFFMTQELDRIKESVDDMKRCRSFTHFKLEDYYRMYIEGGYRKKALKLIKENLLD